MATANTSSATKVTTLADLYEKRNTDVKTGIKLVTEEVDWFRKYPKENIVISGNENRVPVVLAQPISPAMIAEGGNERVMSSPAPVHGTFMPVQMNARYGFTGLAQALDNRARAAMIENQTEFQALMTGYSFGRGVGLQTYGQSSGTLAVVKTTGSASATQVIPLKNAYGAATFCPGGDGGAQDTYLSSLPRVGDNVALIHTGSVLEFGVITAAPSASSGIGFVDVTFNSSITPTAGDLLVLANADGDNTINGTDVNNWSIGFTEILTASSLLGLTATNWTAGSVQTNAQRLAFVTKEKMINDCWNASGLKINRFIIAQGVRRDSINLQGGARRYDSAEYDIEGDLEPPDGQQYFTSQLALPGTMIGWYDKAIGKIELSDMPDSQGVSKSIFKLDKVQGKSQIAAVYDYFFQKVPSSRGATGYATNLQSQ